MRAKDFQQKAERLEIELKDGDYLARIFSVADEGTQIKQFAGKPAEKPKRYIHIGFELVTEKAVYKDGEEPKPITLFKDFYFSTYKKAGFRTFLESVVGVLTDEEADDLEVKKLLGQYVYVTTSMNGSYINIKSFTRVMDKNVKKGGEIDFKYFEIGTHGFSSKEFALLPALAKYNIKKSEEAKMYTGVFAEYKDFMTGEEPEEKGVGSNVQKPDVNNSMASIEEDDDFDF